jgi:nicotinamidase-related amidase
MPETSKIDAPHAALLVMDMQNGLIASLPGSDSLLTRTGSAIDLVRRRGGHVGYVRIGFTPAEVAQIPAHSAMARNVTPERRRDLADDAPATQIHDQIAPQPGDIVVRKIRVGAFSTTDLAEQLEAREITTLILAGIATSGVVLSTFREALDRDYRLVVLADACADRDPATHAFLTETLYPRHGFVTTVAELAALLET